MHKRQASRLEALGAVQSFLDDHAAALPTVINSGAHRKFDELMADIHTHIADQSGSFFTAQIKTRRIHALRRALMRDHMKPIARIAAAELELTPELGALRLPTGTPSLGRLVAHARGMAKLANAHAPVFIEAGLPADFLDRFGAATDALTAETAERMRSHGERGGATRGLEDKLARARKMVGVLDAFITAALHDDPRLADWRMVKRVHRGTRPSRSLAPAGEGAVSGA